MAISFRQLEPSDVSLMQGVLDCFAVAFEDHENYSSARPDDSYLAELLSDDGFVVLVALDGELVAGATTAYVLRKFEQRRNEMYIYDLAVLETHRRCGIATTMLQKLWKLAKAKACYTVYVQADREDLAAVALYEQMAEAADVVHFDLFNSAST